MDFPFNNSDVKSAYEGYPKYVGQKLLALRSLVLSVAADIPEVGIIEEDLKWGQPSFLTSKSKSGSTIRVDAIKGSQTQYAMYFNCQTTLVAQFREIYGDLFRYEKNRAIHFHINDDPPIKALEDCVAMALTYHLQRKA